MEHQHFIVLINDILLILALSGVIIPALQRVRISPILGYLFCGLLIGPYSMGMLTETMPWVSWLAITDTKVISVLAELGVVFLLFMVGLKLSFSKLWALRRLVVGLGGLQFLITAFTISCIAFYFENSIETSILIGASFALSSTAIVMQLLMDRHMVSQLTGRVTFSVLLLQDLAVVPILVLVSFFGASVDGNGTSAVILLVQSLAVAVAVVLGILVFGKRLLRPLLYALSPAKNTEWLFAVSLFIVIGTAGLTQSFGLSAALGAFLAGVLIGETEYKHEIAVMLDPVKGVLMGIFFLSVGMSTNLAALLENPFWIVGSVLGIFLLKSTLFYPLALLFNIPHLQAIKSSIMLAQCGEFAFIIINLALMGNLLPEMDAQFFLLVATVSLLLTPATTKLSDFIAHIVKKRQSQAKENEDTTIPQQEGHIIIAGFGRVGRTLADILERRMLPYVAIDRDVAHVSNMRSQGYPVIYGNARRIDLWRRLHGDHAKAIVITIDDHDVSDAVLQALRKEWPLVPIIVRVKDTQSVEEYYRHGASVVVPETLEATLSLVHKLLDYYDVSPDMAQELTSQYRKEVLFYKHKNNDKNKTTAELKAELDLDI